jgi:hypothetical protein
LVILIFSLLVIARDRAGITCDARHRRDLGRVEGKVSRTVGSPRTASGMAAGAGARLAVEADEARSELCRDFTKPQAVIFSRRVKANIARKCASRCYMTPTAAICPAGRSAWRRGKAVGAIVVADRRVAPGLCARRTLASLRARTARFGLCHVRLCHVCQRADELGDLGKAFTVMRL